MPVISTDIFSNLVRTPNLLNTKIEIGKYTYVEEDVRTYGEDDKEFLVLTYQNVTTKLLIQFTSFDLQSFHLGNVNSITALQKTAKYKKDAKIEIIENFEILNEISIPKKDRIYPLYSYTGYNQYKIDKDSEDSSIKDTAKDTLKATKLKAGFSDSYGRKVNLKTNLLIVK